jgi:hypothetical protein
MNNVFTLRKHGLSCNLRYDFLSYLTLPKSNIYLAQQCSYVEFTLFYNRFISGTTAQATLVEVKRGQHMSKLMRSKWGAIGNVLGNILETCRTHLELDENSLEISWEHIGSKGKNERSSSPLPPPKKEKIRAPWVHAAPSHWLHVIFIFTTGLSLFRPRLMAGAQTVGHSLA